MKDSSFIKENQVAILGAFLFIGILGAAIIMGGSLVEIKKYDKEEISVTGAAEKIITSDLVTWRCSFNRRADSLENAFAALKKDLVRVQSFLADNGIPREAQEVSQITTTTLYEKDSEGNDTNKIEGYQLSQNIDIESNDVDKISNIATQSSTLIQEGIGLESYSPEYFYTKLTDLKVEMLGKASENAKARATEIAKSTGNRIGFMHSADMGVFQITPKNSTDVSDYGYNDTSSKVKKVTAVVSVSFAVR